jgi:hypothetical protein
MKTATTHMFLIYFSSYEHVAFNAMNFEHYGFSRCYGDEGGKVVSPTHRPSLSPGRIPGTH